VNIDSRYIFAPLLGHISFYTAISVYFWVDISRALFTFFQEPGSLYIPGSLCWHDGSWMGTCPPENPAALSYIMTEVFIVNHPTEKEGCFFCLWHN